MRFTEIVGVCGLIVALGGGFYSFGILRGEVNALNPQTIREAQEEALRAIDARLEAFNTSPAMESFEWRDSEEPVQMIAVNAGICYLTLVTGFFHNMNEDVAKVFILGNYWYLGGSTSQYGTGAEATCWRFPKLAVTGLP